METLPHQEPVALIQCLGLKAGPLNRVIIAHMLCLQHPGTKQGWHRGHSRLTLRFLSTLTHTIHLTRDYLPRYKKTNLCIKGIVSAIKIALPAFSEMSKHNLICLLPQPAVARAQPRVNGFSELLKDQTEHGVCSSSHSSLVKRCFSSHKNIDFSS